MEITAHLIQQIQNGKAILFLGAGASLCAVDSHGNPPPSGKKLGEMLSGQFLGGKFGNCQLSQIAELAISESDLTTVQDFIKGIFEPFQPSDAHKLLPKFKWAGIATTNYDRLIEKAYESDPSALQVPKPFIENGDRVEDNMRDPKGLMLLKLHGCITRLSNPKCPLILTTDQYITHRNGRDRIFSHLTNWAYELTIVFIGSSLQDPDLRAILLELSSLAEARPRYFIVAPHMDEIEVRMWNTRRISAIKGSFFDFMRKIDADIASPWRSLSAEVSSVEHPVKEKFTVKNVTLSRNCLQFLESDVDYVKSTNPSEALDSRDFYKGNNKEWSAIEQNLDLRRILGDQILADKLLEDETNKPKGLEFILIKAHAGAGKTILLRRIAWDAAHDYNLLCLFLKQSGSINTAALQEILSICKERVYLFIDDAADRVRELQSLIKNIEQFGKRLTLIAAERVNEWNVSGTCLAPHITDEYELKYLVNFEVDKLLTLLTTHKALGTLTGKTLDEQRNAFRETAGRQLLVALHEATLGKRFEEIIEDEFRNVAPLEAQNIYLTICVLNRLGVPVRAGIIARLHGVRFEVFQERLFKPLEHVVSTAFDPVVRDYMYSARHPFIAEIVFERMLRNQEEKYDKYIKCLNALNIDYGCDRKAFRLMIRGRSLLDLFSDRILSLNVYDIAERITGEDGYLFHQKGLYEMHNGNHRRAGELFSKAEQLAPYDYSIKHSRSELLLKCADQARTSLEKEKLLREATDIATSIRNSKVATESHAYHTLVKIDLQRLASLLATPVKESQQAEIESVIKHIEKNLSDGLQRFPGDSYLLTAESEFASQLDDSERVIESLQKAFIANPRTTFIAVRLATHYCAQDKPQEATKIIEQALNANRSDRALHYHFARHLMKYDKANNDLVTYHLQRSFSTGDFNYDAQLLFGRQLYISGDKEESKGVFARLREAKLSPELKSNMLYPIEGYFQGPIVRIEGNYAFVGKDGASDWVHLHRNNIDDASWMKLTKGSRCIYKIAFNFYGAGAFETKLATSV